jgi:hypothetical protein
MYSDRALGSGERMEIEYPLLMANVRAGDDWVYFERIGATLAVWTGPACNDCKPAGRGLKRCRLHASVAFVALQYRMMDWVGELGD